MFAPRSPGAAGKNKRKRSGSERPSSTADPVVRLSPTLGHENVRALSQPQSMPFLPPSSLQSGSLGLGDDPVSRHSPVDTIANSSGDEPSCGQSMIAKKKKLPKRVEQPKAHGDQPIILAPSGRPYLQFQDGSKSLGILIPDGWKPHSQPGSDRQYPCPVRNCPALYPLIKGLSSHFNKAHRDCLFNDNLDGTIEIISQRRPDGQGRVVVSQVPRPLMSDAGPSLVVSDLGEAESRDVSKDAPNTAEANQQGDKRQVVTTWDAVNSTYDCVPAAFEECPGDATISFLASLPAAEGALAANDKKGPGKVFRIPDYRWGKLYNLKAALVQAHGLHAETPCGKCAAGKSLWTTCMRAPTLPGGEQDVFSGACASCFYGGQKLKCDRIHEVASQKSQSASASAATPADISPEDDHERQRSNSIQQDPTFHLAPEGATAQKNLSQRVSAGPPPNDSSNQRQSDSAQIALISTHVTHDSDISQEDHSQNMSTNEQNAEDLKFKLQDLTMKMARRARMLPLDERPDVIDRVQSLLTMDSLEPEGLQLARCVFGLPDEEKVGATKMILEILRSLLG